MTTTDRRARRPLDACCLIPRRRKKGGTASHPAPTPAHKAVYLDDIYAVALPDRVRTVNDTMAEELHAHTRIQLNTVWNSAGLTPPGLEPLGL